MKKITLLCILLSVCSLFFLPFKSEAEEPTPPIASKFLDLVRRNHPSDTWAMMSGEVSHKRKGAAVTTTPIKLSIRFTNIRALTKIVMGEENKQESYTVGQPYNGDAPSIITSTNMPDLSKMANCGLRPEDLTMAFLYWKLEKELDEISVSGMSCRVLLLSNQETKEQVKIYVAKDYYYPMKAEWIKVGGVESYRTYCIDTFIRVDKLWAPDSFHLYGPGWRTEVKFDEVKLGYVKDGLPKNIF